MNRSSYKYNDSGIVWMGELPEGWSCKKLNQVVRSMTKKSCDDDSNYISLENIECNTGRRVKTKSDDPGQETIVFLDGDVLYGKLRPYLNKVYLADSTGICSSEFFVLRPISITSKFLFYYTISDTFCSHVDSSTYGAKMPRANWNYVGNIFIPVPSVTTQISIADFLDRETARIDALIEKKEKLIELLKEKRIALITHAVTKGLDPNAPMKDSGIEWLGEVPEHWEVKKLKYLGKSLIGLTYNPNDIVYENGTLVLRASNIQNSSLTLNRDDDVFVETKIPKNLMVVDGDILICSRNGSKALIGKSAIIRGNVSATFGAFMTVFRSRNNRFVIWILHSSMFSSLCSGYVTSTINQLTQDDLNKISIPQPPENEIKEITEHLENETYNIDSLILKTENTITLLSEYRASLINAAVTGKIDVRNQV